MNEFSIHKSFNQSFSMHLSEYPLLCLYSLKVMLELQHLFQPTLRYNASEINQVPNQIIVKYKETSFSPLAKDSKDSQSRRPSH